MRVRRILFDLDGTLVDSTDAVARSWTVLAGELGIEPERIVGRYHGMPARMALPRIDPTLDDAAIDRLEAHLLELELADTDGVVALPGARALLTSLDPDAWAVVTSCSTALAAVRLESAGLPTPGVMVCADEVSRGKPDPEPYLLGAERCGVDPAECLVVEDAPAGVASARAAGCAVVGVLTTHDTLDVPVLDALGDLRVEAAGDGWWEVGGTRL